MLWGGVSPAAGTRPRVNPSPLSWECRERAVAAQSQNLNNASSHSKTLDMKRSPILLVPFAGWIGRLHQHVDPGQPARHHEDTAPAVCLIFRNTPPDRRRAEPAPVRRARPITNSVLMSPHWRSGSFLKGGAEGRWGGRQSATSSSTGIDPDDLTFLEGPTPGRTARSTACRGR